MCTSYVGHLSYIFIASKNTVSSLISSKYKNRKESDGLYCISKHNLQRHHSSLPRAARHGQGLAARAVPPPQPGAPGISLAQGIGYLPGDGPRHLHLHHQDFARVCVPVLTDLHPDAF